MRREARSKKQEAGSKKTGVGRWGWLAICTVGAIPAWGQLLPTGPQMNVSGGATNVSGQEAPPPRWPVRDRSKGIELTISAQAEGKPALQYALLPRMEETERGNPAVKYLAASAEMPQGTNDDAELIDAARQNALLADLNESEPAFQRILNPFGAPLRSLKEGARLEGMDLDWENNVRKNGFSALLPSLGKLRLASNVLALKIRFDIKRHDWKAAREKLDTGYALARHLGRGQTVIESLVGTAIATIMNRALEDWIAEPGSPNVYWPLTNLPAPYCDMRRPLEFERASVYFSFPEIKEIQQGRYSADTWRTLIGHLYDYSGFISNDPVLFDGVPATPVTRQIGTAALGVLMYPQAKDFLVKRGLSREAVEKMPAVEALERFFLTSWDEESDDLFKWAGLSAKEATEGMQQAERDREARQAAGEANLFVTMFLPSLGRVRLMGARLDRQIAALRIIEAMRAYAAEKGALPENLAALKLPLPSDPVRSEPFVYQLKDGKGVLSSPAANPRDGLQYELTLRK